MEEKNTPWKLNDNPEQAAKEVVDQAKRQYPPKNYEIFRYRFLKEAEDKL